MAPSDKIIILLSFFVRVTAFFLQAGYSTAARPQPPANLNGKVAASHASSPATHLKASHKQSPSPATHPKATHKQAPSPATHLKAAQKQAPSPALGHHQLPRNKANDNSHVTKSTVKPPPPAEKLKTPPPTAAVTERIPDMRSDFGAYDLYLQTHVPCYFPPLYNCGKARHDGEPNN